jgi:hypothetical protein
MSETGPMDAVTVAARAAAEVAFDGLVDADEFVAKNMPGPSDMHINSASRPRPKRSKKQQRRLREAQVGLANNAFGAAAGGVATAAAYKQAKNLNAEGMKATRTGRALLRATKGDPRKLKYAVPAAGAAMVGMQAANGLMDAQSGQYFAREVYNQTRPVRKAFNPAAAVSQRFKIHRLQNPSKKAKAAGQANTRDLALKNRGRVLGGIAVGGVGGGALAGYSYGAAAPGRVKPTKEELLAPIGKADDSYDVTWSGEFSKRDDEKRQVFGWANVSEIDGQPVLDRQGDFVPVDEMEKSAYDYVINSRKGGDMHKRVKKGLTTNFGDEPLHTSDLIESMIVTPEKLQKMGVPAEVSKSVPVGWWVGFQVNDEEQWQMVKNGERTGFSIHGRGKRSDAFAKADRPMSDAKLRNKKSTQAKLSMVGAGLGLGALGLKGAGGAARHLGQVEGATTRTGQAVRRIVPRSAQISPAKGQAWGDRADKASNTALTFGAGVGGAGGINFAQVQRAESKKRPVPVSKAGYDPEEARQKRAKEIVAGTAGLAGAAAVETARRAGTDAAISSVRQRRRIDNGKNMSTWDWNKKQNKNQGLLNQATGGRVEAAKLEGKAARKAAAGYRSRTAKATPSPDGTSGLRRAVRVLRQKPGTKTGVAAAATAALGTAAVAGERNRRKTAAPYKPVEWYTR